MSAQAKEHPIIFSAPMVLALLAGTKTQTRRKVNCLRRPIENLAERGIDRHRVNYSGQHNDPCSWGYPAAEDGVDMPLAAWLELCPYGVPGDRLWVRETWGVGTRPDMREGWRDGIEWRADQGEGEDDLLPLYPAPPDIDLSTIRKGWHSPIHMPRWASRITLEITEVRVERLQDISANDILVEGAVARAHDDQFGHNPVSALKGKVDRDLKSLYAAGWERVNGQGSWEANPWVWALTFKRISPW